jgi:hypothetical protein
MEWMKLFLPILPDSEKRLAGRKHTQTKPGRAVMSRAAAEISRKSHREITSLWIWIRRKND